jgi:hypothetical protein
VTLLERFNNSTGAGGNTTIIVLTDGPKSEEIQTETGPPRSGSTGTNVCVTITLRPMPDILMSSLKVLRDGAGNIITGTPA